MVECRHLQPPHSRDADDDKPQRGSEAGQQRPFVCQLSPLPSRPVSKRCIPCPGHGRSANPCRNDTPSQSRSSTDHERTPGQEEKHETVVHGAGRSPACIGTSTTSFVKSACCCATCARVGSRAFSTVKRYPFPLEIRSGISTSTRPM